MSEMHYQITLDSIDSATALRHAVILGKEAIESRLRVRRAKNSDWPGSVSAQVDRSAVNVLARAFQAFEAAEERVEDLSELPAVTAKHGGLAWGDGPTPEEIDPSLRTNLQDARELIAEMDEIRAVMRELKAAFARSEATSAGGWGKAVEHPLYLQAEKRLAELHEEMMGMI